MENQPPEKAEYTLALVAGVLHLRWTPGSVIGEGDVRAVREKAAKLCSGSGHPHPLLLDLAGMEWIDHVARNVLASWPLAQTAIVGASPVDEILVHFYIARHSPACPTKYFTRLDEARTWLTAANTPADAARTPPAAVPAHSHAHWPRGPGRDTDINRPQPGNDQTLPSEGPGRASQNGAGTAD